jgi:hypothetical protein
MKHIIKISAFILLAIITLGLTVSVTAQRLRPAPNTTSKMLYHNGPVLTGTINVYPIWYGCWSEACGNADSTQTIFVLADFMSTLGSTPYFQINSTYPNSSGIAPSGGILYAGGDVDPYQSHGFELTATDVEGIIADQVLGSRLPLDPSGVYLVLASPNVSSQALGFCTAVNTPPYHGVGEVLGTQFRYGFVGDPKRCPTLEAPQFVATDGTLLPTPNSNLAGDSMAAKIAHVLNTIVTDPSGGAWYDRYGLENADKCQGTFGQTYTVANGARANIRLGQRDFLLGQNWVNDRRGRCALSQ